MSRRLLLKFIYQSYFLEILIIVFPFLSPFYLSYTFREKREKFIITLLIFFSLVLYGKYGLYLQMRLNYLEKLISWEPTVKVEMLMQKQVEKSFINF